MSEVEIVVLRALLSSGLKQQLRRSSFLIAFAATALPSAGFTEPTSDRAIAQLESRLFPELSKIDAAKASPDLARLLQARRTRIAACKGTSDCVLASAAWPEAEIAVMAAGPASADIRRELAGINEILLVYGGKKVPLYPLIDGPDGVGTVLFQQDVDAAIRLADAEYAARATKPDWSVELALSLLDVADRFDAVAFEPIDAGENAAAFQRATSIKWAKFPYSAIIVLGVGPEQDFLPISARSKLNARLAADRYMSGQAPFIIVSGASVHPRRTKLVEAIQLKRQLIERFAIPEAAIVIEPYARHTTTNMRNAARLLQAMRAPAGRPTLVVSNDEHIASIAAPAFTERNQRELGYVPGSFGPRISPNDIVFVPADRTFPIDPKDPLDP